jgi:hypothetical protein
VVWFLSEDLELLDQAGAPTPEHVATHCWELTEEDFGPNDET